MSRCPIGAEIQILIPWPGLRLLAREIGPADQVWHAAVDTREMLQTTDQGAADRRLPRPAAARASTVHRLMTIWLLGLGVLAVVAFQDRVPVEDLLLDRAVIGGGNWYSGMVTSLVVVVWTTAAVSAFGAAYSSHIANRRAATRAFASAGAIVSLLLLDDLFLLHSVVMPRLLGVPKLALMTVEAGAVVAWWTVCRAEIVRTRWELLVAALAGFAVSVVVDSLVTPSSLSLVIEDGGKLLGALALAMWSVSAAADLVASAVRATNH